MGNHWTLQDAKNKFSAVVEAAQNGVPQHVTKRGADAVVIVSAEEYERLLRDNVKPKTPKKSFVEHILSAPKLPPELEDMFDKKEPMILEMREIDFEE